MNYFRYKNLMKKRKSFYNIRFLFSGFLSKFADEDQKMLLTYLHNLNQVISFLSKIAPVFIYGLIFYLKKYVDPIVNTYYIATIYLIVSIWFTNINNDDYDPLEIENVAQWMYKAPKDKFKLFICRKLLRTFGINIIFYSIFVFLYVSKWKLAHIIFAIILATLIIALKFLWSNNYIFYLFFNGPNTLKKKDVKIRLNQNHLNIYQRAIIRSCKNKEYYLNIVYVYLFSFVIPIIILLVSSLKIHNYLIVTYYLAICGVIVSFISQGIINASKMFNQSNFSDFYFIKKFDNKSYFENLLFRFILKRLLLILISYYIGLFILYGFSLKTHILYFCSVIICLETTKIISKRVFRFKKLSIEDITNNFFIYFFNPVEDLFIIGFPVIISSFLAIYSIEISNIFPIIIFFLLYSTIIILYNNYYLREG